LQAECPLIESEQVCFTSAGTAKEAVRDWTNRGHQKYWVSLPGLKRAIGIPTRILCQKNKGLLKLNRKQL
jgi:hypothetical protein